MRLYQEWLYVKQQERSAQERRREIEDLLGEQLGITGTEGNQAIESEGFQVKITCRVNRTINADLLQEIAAENGLTEHLGTLFRWKPDINKKAWEATDEGITAPLLDAITAKPGRPSFSIEPIDDNQEK